MHNKVSFPSMSLCLCV